jgi:hypothetical protein
MTSCVRKWAGWKRKLEDQCSGLSQTEYKLQLMGEIVIGVPIVHLRRLICLYCEVLKPMSFVPIRLGIYPRHDIQACSVTLGQGEFEWFMGITTRPTNLSTKLLLIPEGDKMANQSPFSKRNAWSH